MEAAEPRYVTLLAGSHLYGTSMEGSDIDIAKVALPSPDEVLGLRRPERVGGDTSLYSFSDFARLLLKGSLQHFELLFSDVLRHNSYQAYEAWRGLVEIRDSFWCRKMISGINGYINAEMRRIERQRRWLRDDVFPEERRGHRSFSPPSKIVADGWDTKGAYHCVRIIAQANQYEREGTITFPLDPDVISRLMDIRLGRVSYEEWMSQMEAERFDWNASDNPELAKIRAYLRGLALGALEEVET